jgi:hypothetical protein
MHGYLRHPFPSHKAFGPYASPGPVVHLPAMVLLIGMSWILSNETWPVTLPTMIISAICSIYLGRDLAIKAHYNVLITLCVFVMLLASLSVGLLPLQKLHQWAVQFTWGWPGLIYALLLAVLLGWRIKHHHD